ncbi:glycosyl hydrolase [Microbacterium flavum]|uniref:glycosyl hydrolase n=1 Tax=Microbacterium flavum TaxID=415216 RepID=UPI0024ACFD74|nr:glycosyl hydrolase [Microbacterium flavum]
MTRRASATVATLATVAAAALVLAGCAAESTPPAQPTPEASSAVAGLPVEHVATISPVRLAEGVVPPTNRWYSSLAFSPDLLPIYPSPLAVAPREDGLTIQVPPVAVGEKSITASFSGGLSLGLGATSLEVVRTDPVSVTVAYSAGDAERARVTLAQGSPIVAIAAATDLDITLSAAPTSVGDKAWTAVVDGVTYLLRGDAQVSGSTVSVGSGKTLQVAGLPKGADPAAWASAIGDPVTDVASSYVVGDSDVTTRLAYEGTDRTVVVPFAGRTAASSCDLGTYDTPYGPLQACASSTLEWTVPRITAQTAYDFDGLDDTTRQTIAAQATADLADTPPTPADTYFGGKGLARIASLLELGKALGDTQLVSAATDRLATELKPWTDPSGCTTEATRCFVYDDVLHLVVGKQPSFGSEEGNDHHFHYGYFLFAAGVLGTERPELVDGMRPVMDALAADVAAGSAELPALRAFDPYRGHSWASGPAPFADGNNQESSSEAVSAWNGLATWAAAAGDDSLGTEAAWLLSSEADAARTLWLEPENLPAGFTHTMVSLNWSSKRDYATWFSADPSAILGIQAVPVGPVSLQYLGKDPKRVAENVADAGDTAFTGPLGDYVQAYSALASPDAATAAATAFAARATFDDGWSKALALAWAAAAERSQ